MPVKKKPNYGSLKAAERRTYGLTLNALTEGISVLLCGSLMVEQTAESIRSKNVPLYIQQTPLFLENLDPLLKPEHI